MHWIKGETSSGGAKDAAISPNVVVFGSGIEALHVIEKLRQAGTDPTTIVWVYRRRPDFGYEQVNKSILLSGSDLILRSHSSPRSLRMP